MSSEHVSAPAAYDLTSFTGRKKNAERVFFVRNFEVNLFTAAVAGASFVAGIPVGLALYFLILVLAPSYAFAAIGAPVITAIIGLAFVDSRSKRGLQLRQYRALMDKRTARSAMGSVYVAGAALPKPELSFHTPQFVLVTPTSSVKPVAGVNVLDDNSTGKVNLFDA